MQKVKEKTKVSDGGMERERTARKDLPMIKFLAKVEAAVLTAEIPLAPVGRGDGGAGAIGTTMTGRTRMSEAVEAVAGVDGLQGQDHDHRGIAARLHPPPSLGATRFIGYRHLTLKLARKTCMRSNLAKGHGIQLPSSGSAGAAGSKLACMVEAVQFTTPVWSSPRLDV